MNYKPKRKEFENPEIEILETVDPPKFFEAFCHRGQIKIARGDPKGHYASTDAFCILLQDLFAKKLIEEGAIMEIVRSNITKAIKALNHNNFEAAQMFAYQTLDPTDKRKQFEMILMATLTLESFSFVTNRFCKKQGSALLVL